MNPGATDDLTFSFIVFHLLFFKSPLSPLQKGGKSTDCDLPVSPVFPVVTGFAFLSLTLAYLCVLCVLRGECFCFWPCLFHSFAYLCVLRVFAVNAFDFAFAPPCSPFPTTPVASCASRSAVHRHRPCSGPPLRQNAFPGPAGRWGGPMDQIRRGRRSRESRPGSRQW